MFRGADWLCGVLVTAKDFKIFVIVLTQGCGQRGYWDII
jgi:hypothetical protein